MSELKEQRYIIEIAKVQGVAKAAENLFISQPALSKFLTRTEEMYGVQLFERIGKKMIPNEIINKPGRLKEDKFYIKKKHSEYGYNLLTDR